MDNNNIYFSCFSLIRACVSSLFANFYKVVCVCLVVCFALCSPLAAFAGTTESMMMFTSGSVFDEYAVMPLDLYTEDEVIKFDAYFALGDFQLDTYTNNYSTHGSFNVTNDVRFDASNWNYMKYPFLQSVDKSKYINTVQFAFTLSNADDNEWLYADILGLNFDINGLYMRFRAQEDDTVLGRYVLSNKKPLAIEYRSRTSDGTLVSHGFVNLNNVTYDGQTCGIKFNIPAKSGSALSVSELSFYVYYDISDIPLDYNRVVCDMGFYSSSSYVRGDFISTPSNNNSSDYQQNVEVELGNIQTGINNVINSVVQMGNQAWQGAQQTVQAVTQMTQQLNTAIDQQRQDILDGLGLLGDDITGTLSDVKTEITNIGSSITNKIESTTETITNTIETKVDEVTESVGEVKQSIFDLPNKIKDMLLGLIVPDAETMGGKYSEFTELLEAKLGVIYQIPAMILELFETLVSGVTDPQTTLTFPSLSLPWIDGTQMKLWDSIEFEIIPTGMDVLKELIQTVTSMVCVIMTFNSVKRIYENFLRGR